MGNRQEYVLRKIVKASSAAEALQLDSSTPVHEVCIKDNNNEESKRLESCIGFMTPLSEDESL